MCKNKILIENFIIDQKDHKRVCIGKGKSAKIYRAINKQNQKIYAVKMVI